MMRILSVSFYLFSISIKYSITRDVFSPELSIGNTFCLFLSLYLRPSRIMPSHAYYLTAFPLCSSHYIPRDHVLFLNYGTLFLNFLFFSTLLSLCFSTWCREFLVNLSLFVDCPVFFYFISPNFNNQSSFIQRFIVFTFLFSL